jgi:hypothetical protein
MTHQEKRAWIMLVVSLITYATYLITFLARTDGRPLASVPYVASLLWTVGGSIVASIVAETAIGIFTPRASRDKDVRDREIAVLGDRVGQSFIVIGAVAAMLMAMAGWDSFWIANVIYLCFALSAVLSSVTKVIVYRKTFPQW